jgi:hypothetical protein
MNKKTQELLKGLKSDKIEIQSQSIESLGVNGDDSAIIPLLDLWKSTDNDGVSSKIHALFCDIKLSDAPKIIIGCLEKGSYNKIHSDILNSIWNSGLDYTMHIPELTRIAIEGDFSVAFEALTIIENQKGTFTEEITLETMLIVKDFEAASTAKDLDKTKMIAAIKSFIHGIDGQL